MATQKIIDFAFDLAGFTAPFFEPGNTDEYILRGLESSGYITESQRREIVRNPEHLIVNDNKWVLSNNEEGVSFVVGDASETSDRTYNVASSTANGEEKRGSENASQIENGSEKGEGSENATPEYEKLSEDKAHADEPRDVAKISSIYSNNSAFDMKYETDKKFSSLEAEELRAEVNKLYAPLENITNMVDSVSSTFDGMNDDTKSKVSDIGPGAYLATQLKTSIFKWTDYVDTMSSNITTCLKTAGYFDGTEGPGSTDPTITTPDGSNPGYGGDKSPTKTPNFADTGTGSGGVKDPNPVTVVSTVFGSLVFTSIVPLYSEIGKPSTIQSSLTGQYDVTGIVYQDGKYYYRIYDKNLKTIYFAEVDKNSTFKTDYKEVLKMNEENLMLNKPEIGDNTLSKLSDPKEVYFANGTTPGTGDAEGITFVNVLDSSDGKNYYVALNDSVELTPIESLVSGASVAPETEIVG